MRHRPRVEHSGCNVMMTGRCLDQVAHASREVAEHPLSAAEGASRRNRLGGGV
jgi:hypothetical protein